MQELFLFLFCFFVILIAYEVFIVVPMIRYRSKKKKGKKFCKEKSDPVEIKFLVCKFGLNLEKVNYNRLLQLVTFVSSFDMAVIVSIIALIDGYLLQMLLALVLAIPIFLGSYFLVAKYYEKKGMIKHV